MGTYSFTVKCAAALVLAIAVATASTPLTAQVSKSTTKSLACAVPAEITRLEYTLSRTARRLVAGEPLTIVAIGSSSTGGAFASSPAATYPSRLAVALKERFPGHVIRVLNKGANGEDAREMLARFQESVIAENPDLVLWQVGTNSLLLDRPLTSAGLRILEGVRRLKTEGIDIVLLDAQFAPKLLAKRGVETLMDLYGTISKQETVCVFHRFAAMRYWHEVAGIPFEVFLSPDDLHMNDWSYDCIAQLLAGAIAEAATRSALAAGVAGPKL